MRLDKFLKVSRIIKRRSVAKDASEAGIVKVNGREGKASTKLKVGDILEVTFGEKTMTIKVVELIDTTRKEDAARMYEVVS